MAITLNGTTGITTPGLSADSPTLTVDSDNNRVGIGVTNPQYSIHVEGTTATSNVWTNVSNLSSGAFIYNNIGLPVVGISANGAGSNGGVIQLYDRVTGDTQIHLDSAPGQTPCWILNRNVGIGTTNPLTKLDIRSGVITAGSVDAPNGAEILRGYYSAGALAVIGSEYSSGGIVIGSSVKPSTTTSNAFLSSTSINVSRGAYTIAGNIHKWYIGSAQTVAENSAVTTLEVMRIDPNGNVGIGTTNPSDKLHVQGAVRTSQLSISTATFNYIGGSGTDLLVNGDDNITFRTDNEVERVRITASGLVGIGTTNPQSKLDVYNGNIQFTRISPYTNTWYIFQSHVSVGTYGSLYFQPTLDTGDFIYYSNTGTDLVRFKHNGNVGIGTSNPLYKLDVRGGSWINGASIQGASVSFGASPVTKTITISTSNTEAITIVASGFTSGGGHSAVKQFMVGGYIPGSTQYAAATVSSATTGSSMSISDITKANNSFSFTMTLSASLNSQGEISVLSRYPVTITIS